MKKILNNVIVFVSSLNVTISILALLLLTFLAAIMEDRIIALSRFVHPSRGSLIRGLLHCFAPADLHASSWFKSLFIMFSLNLLTCMARRIPGTLRILSRSRPEEAGTIPSSPPFETTFTVATLRRNFEHGLYGLLARNLSIPVVSRSEEKSVFFSQRGKSFHGGFYLAHGGLFILLAGSVLGSSSLSGEMYLREGESTDRLFVTERGTACFRTLDCVLRLDTCEPLSPPGSLTTPHHSNYRSTVSIMREGAENITGVLEGYRTLTGHGMRIGQSRYPEKDSHRILLSIRVKKGGGKRRTFALRSHQFCTIPETGHTVRLRAIFLPPASSTPSLTDSPSSSLPCMASLEVYGDTRSLIYTPLVSRQASRSGHPWDEEYEFLLEGVEATAPSSRCMRLNISFEPGAPLIWAGSAVAIAGFSLVFFLSHRKLWVAIERMSGGYSITVAGWASRNPEALMHYGRLIRELAHQQPAP